MELLSENNQLRLIRLRTRLRRQVKENALRAWVQVRRAVGAKPKRNDPYDPDEPYAMVTAGTRPRLPRRSGSVAVDPYEC
jgi:hypothetical protein